MKITDREAGHLRLYISRNEPDGLIGYVRALIEDAQIEAIESSKPLPHVKMEATKRLLREFEEFANAGTWRDPKDETVSVFTIEAALEKIAALIEERDRELRI